MLDPVAASAVLWNHIVLHCIKAIEAKSNFYADNGFQPTPGLGESILILEEQLVRMPNLPGEPTDDPTVPNAAP